MWTLLASRVVAWREGVCMALVCSEEGEAEANTSRAQRGETRNRRNAQGSLQLSCLRSAAPSLAQACEGLPCVPCLLCAGNSS